MQNNKKPIFNAGQPLWFWGADNADAVHERATLEFKDDIDGDILLKAWKKTMRVYPLLDCIPAKENGELVFYESDDEPKVINYNAPVTPHCELSAMRPMALSYYKNTLYITTFHSIVDAGGGLGVFRTLIHNYFCLLSGKDSEQEGVVTTENRSIDEYYATQYRLDLGNYTPQPLACYPLGNTLYSDPDAVAPAPGEIVSGSISVPVGDFIKICKAHKANPSVMACILFGKSVYSNDPNERKRVAYAVTVDYRPALGLQNYLGSFSGAITMCTSYEEITQCPIEETAAKLRLELKRQYTPDYAKTIVDISRTYPYVVLPDISAVISYEGRLDFGKYNEYLSDIRLTNNGSNTLHMYEFNGKMNFCFQFGKASKKYQKAFVNELEKLGLVVTDIKEPNTLPKEVCEI